jgi:hypothetical protein
MEFLPIVLVTLQPDQPGAHAIIPFSQRKGDPHKTKAPRQTAALRIVLIRRSAGLLDR